MDSKSKRTRTKAIRLVTATVLVALTLTLVAAILPNVAAQAATPESTFRSRLAANEPAAKFTAVTATAVSPAPTARTATPIVVVAPKVSTPRTARTSSSSSSTNSSASGGDPQAILAGYIARYPILAGSTVSYGDAKGAQAIAYYKSGRIVISPSHTASLERIIAHEIWHIIDWRDNGVIDWGENVPPK